jgi:dinuclear metal center YbgI/SA1388 family protein
MKLKEICAYLDEAVPLPFQEGYDNSGLQVGMADKEITSALLTLDISEEVMNEALKYECDIIISHHPLIFSGIKSITGKNYAERIIQKAIREDIAIYSAHTNLDAVDFGVSRKMAGKLNLLNVKVLLPLKEKLLKLVTFVPESHLERVRDALFDAGAGVIGKYDRCGFTLSGTGSFRPGADTNPYVGEKGKTHFEPEVRLETILYKYMKADVIRALRSSHPYEEIAFDLYPLENENIDAGLGCIGDLERPLPGEEFLRLLSSVFNAQGIRYSGLTGRPLSRIALCGGSGASLLGDALRAGADAFVTGDVKYHTFFDAEKKILLADIGHYESEKFSTEILYDLIIKKFPKFAVRFSETNTNPINYL